MNEYNKAHNNLMIKRNMKPVGDLLKQGKKDEARLVLEYIKVWNEIAYFAKRKAV